MKFQSIFVFLIASLAAGSYAQRPCNIFLQGQFTHVISGQSGCYGTDPTDPVKFASASYNAAYTLYASENCQNPIFAGSGYTNFIPPLQSKSVRLNCPQ
ncbi:2928_t:CDS:2 [Paraglomus occultum]|uniref:2928_t:CDS:1 n=1 Tax=Paraglomus occultum TaxID=144539 RepID=A0A9N9FVJ9_9GLOM|nr:2928_t:CDS:2 [Paraglomus occultum]